MDAGCGQLEYVEEVMGCGFLTAATKFGLQPEWLTGIVGEIQGYVDHLPWPMGVDNWNDLKEGRCVDTLSQTQSLKATTRMPVGDGG